MCLGLLSLFKITFDPSLSSRASATNCARIYNLSSKRLPSIPGNWPHLELDVADAWNSFILHTLLCRHEERGQILVLPHSGHTQSERLLVVIRQENQLDAGPGQEHWNHVCDKCCWLYEKDGVQCECNWNVDSYAVYSSHNDKMSFDQLSLTVLLLATRVALNIIVVTHLNR